MNDEILESTNFRWKLFIKQFRPLTIIDIVKAMHKYFPNYAWYGVPFNFVQNWAMRLISEIRATKSKQLRTTDLIYKAIWTLYNIVRAIHKYISTWRCDEETAVFNTLEKQSGFKAV